MFYTVTATVTTFIKADYGAQAEDILYEALLGNDPKHVLAIAEVHMPVTSVKGVHSTIPVNDDIKPTWAQGDLYQRIIQKPERKETEMDIVAMQAATMNALRLERDKWKDIAEKLADAIQDIHYIFPRMEKLTLEYLDLCDEFFGTDRNA